MFFYLMLNSQMGEWKSGRIILLILQLKRLNIASNIASNMALKGRFMVKSGLKKQLLVFCSADTIKNIFVYFGLEKKFQRCRKILKNHLNRPLFLARAIMIPGRST